MERNFSQRVKDVLGYSREEAERLQNSYIGPEHLLLGILRDGSGQSHRSFAASRSPIGRAESFR